MADLFARLMGKLPVSSLRWASDFRYRHPGMEPALDWLLDRVYRGRDSVIQRGAGKGLRFNPGGAALAFVFGTHEPAVQRVFELLAKPGMTFCDVGANVGFYSMVVARLIGSGGRVFSFEPLADNLRWIEHNARLNGFRHIVARCEALGNIDGETQFMLSEQPTWGKLASAAGAPPARPAGETAVRVRRLDSLLREGAVAPPDLMKLDVEGSEVDVLNGGAETLHRCRPILIIDLHGTNASVAAILAEQRYHAIVLGCARAIVESPWDACVVAAPAEREDLAPLLRELAGSPTAANHAADRMAR